MSRYPAIGAVLVVAILLTALAAAAVSAQDDGWVHLPFVPLFPYQNGKGETGISIQNADRTRAAQIDVEFYEEGSGLLKRNVSAQADPWAATFLYRPSGQPLDGMYAVRAHADRRIAAIARTDWASRGSATIYGETIPDTHVIVPLAMRNHANQCSTVSIQNVDPSGPATAVAGFYRMGDSQPVLEKEVVIPGGSPAVLSLCSDVDLVAGLPDPFLGSLQVSSLNGVDRFAVQSHVKIVPQREAAYAFEGVPAKMADSALYVPLFRASQRLRYDQTGVTGISVTNTGVDDVAVTVTFYPVRDERAGCRQSPSRQTKALRGSSSVVFWQGPGGSPVAAGCYGSATIEASNNGRILAVVVDGVDEQLRHNVHAAAYNAFSIDAAGLVHAVPLFRTGHTKFDLWTGVSVMNVGPKAAEVTLSVTNAVTGETIPDAMSAHAEPNETVNFWPHSIRASGPPWGHYAQAYGSALVESDQPVVVIVNDSSQVPGRTLIDAATYSGIPLNE